MIDSSVALVFCAGGFAYPPIRVVPVVVDVVVSVEPQSHQSSVAVEGLELNGRLSLVTALRESAGLALMAASINERPKYSSISVIRLLTESRIVPIAVLHVSCSAGALRAQGD